MQERDSCSRRSRELTGILDLIGFDQIGVRYSEFLAVFLEGDVIASAQNCKEAFHVRSLSLKLPLTGAQLGLGFA